MDERRREAVDGRVRRVGRGDGGGILVAVRLGDGMNEVQDDGLVGPVAMGSVAVDTIVSSLVFSVLRSALSQV